MNHYDVAIIGLGPAGSILAQLLSKEFRVIAIDMKYTYDQGFQKPCGGLLSSDAQKALAELNLTLPKEVTVDPQIFAVKTIDQERELIRHYQRTYVNVDRHKFDLWLKSLIPGHVEVHDHSRCSAVERVDSGYQITFHENKIKHVITAKHLVGADGANSLVRRFLYPDKKIRTYMAIQQWFPEQHDSPFYSCIFDEKITDCYSWSISKDNHFIFGGAYLMDKPREQFDLQKERIQSIGFQFGEPIKTEACMVLRPSSFHDFSCGRDNAFLVGEAAGFISPSSLEGISSAINSARTLSEVLNARSLQPNKSYQFKTLPIQMKMYAKLLKCPFMYHPFLRQQILRSGVQSISMQPGHEKIRHSLRGSRI
ncbi:FAD-binding protein [Paenibacillus apis]|uniref:Oxidoreductase n=1 Tax=Paenibacillus apis TaxID=1792174 RepID=A0A919Y7I1_9BACL|nr:FAD-binding protein [Paenibacillus apis]GIO43745.1 oxidoreductase [Paenibacillus apis]